MGEHEQQPLKYSFGNQKREKLNRMTARFKGNNEQVLQTLFMR